MNWEKANGVMTFRTDVPNGRVDRIIGKNQVLDKWFVIHQHLIFEDVLMISGTLANRLGDIQLLHYREDFETQEEAIAWAEALSSDSSGNETLNVDQA